MWHRTFLAAAITLGVVETTAAATAGVINIMDHLHAYVLASEDDEVHTIPANADQLGVDCALYLGNIHVLQELQLPDRKVSSCHLRNSQKGYLTSGLQSLVMYKEYNILFKDYELHIVRSDPYFTHRQFFMELPYHVK